jgi:hypothetical protein
VRHQRRVYWVIARAGRPPSAASRCAAPAFDASAHATARDDGRTSRAEGPGRAASGATGRLRRSWDLSPSGPPHRCATRTAAVWVTFRTRRALTTRRRKTACPKLRVRRRTRAARQHPTPQAASVHLWEDKGPELVHDLRGMFTYALHDTTRRTLMLARDRAGKKPLYWHDDGSASCSRASSRRCLPIRRCRREVDPSRSPTTSRSSTSPRPAASCAAWRKLPRRHRLLCDGARAAWWSATGSCRSSPDRTISEADAVRACASACARPWRVGSCPTCRSGRSSPRHRTRARGALMTSLEHAVKTYSNRVRGGGPQRN